jgi:hypothetical protein
VSRRRWRAVVAGCLLLSAGSLGCGPSSAVPQPLDAAATDEDAQSARDAAAIDASVCACPGTELLSRDNFIDVWRLRLEDNGSKARLVDCPLKTDLPISGGCMFHSLTEPAFLSGYSRIGNPTFGYATWACHTSQFAAGINVGVRCVRPLDRGEATAEECMCPEYETPADRIFYVPQSVTLQPSGITTVSPSCPSGSVLLGGSCHADHAVKLLGQGPHPDDTQVWQCSWHNTFEGEINGDSAAICMYPPGLDALTGEPVAPEIIEYVFTEDTLPANGTYITSATCDRGDTLLAGGCQLDEVTADLEGLALKHIGLAKPQDNAPNTFQCGWGNPTSLTPKVFVMATCMKAAAAPAAE